MKIIHWNESRVNGRMTGIKRYEDELFLHINKYINISRLMRGESKYKDNMISSWFLKYKSYGADIVHGTTQTIAPVALFNKPKRFIVTVHDIIPLLYPSTIEDISKRIQWLLIPKALHKVDHIIAVSKFVKLQLIQHLNIPEDKITVIYEGVNHDTFKPIDRDTCCNALGYDPDLKYILSIKSTFSIKGYEPYKRYDIVERVVSEISKQRDDVVHISIGDYYIDDYKLPLIYNVANVLLYPSEHPTFEFPILEAMSCGTPVVCVNTGSNPEIVGNVGVLIDDINSTDQFVEATLKLLDKPKPNRTCINQSSKFDWSITAEETLKLYNEVVNNESICNRS